VETYDFGRLRSSIAPPLSAVLDTHVVLAVAHARADCQSVLMFLSVQPSDIWRVCMQIAQALICLSSGAVVCAVQCPTGLSATEGMA
jgi:hypothetical protein